MKICPKCNTGNDDNAVQCKDCGDSLSKVNMEEYQDYILKLEQKNQKKHRQKMLIHSIVLFLFAILNIFFYIKALNNSDLVGLNFIVLAGIIAILLLIAYVAIHHPKTLFIIGHFFTIDNIDEVELSDWYIFWTKLSGITLLIVEIVFMAMLAANILN